MKASEGQSVLPAPTVINSSPAFNGNFLASFAANGDAGYAAGSEFASQGSGANMFIDFDFGASIKISGLISGIGWWIMSPGSTSYLLTLPILVLPWPQCRSRRMQTEIR